MKIKVEREKMEKKNIINVKPEICYPYKPLMEGGILETIKTSLSKLVFSC
jgi:hypothetical protein